MAHEIKMPQLSDTMHEGKIISWRKNEGDSVTRGDILAEVETDKANLEIEAFVKGTLLKISTPAGQVAKVGDIIAIVGEPGEAIAGTSSSPSASAASAVKNIQPLTPAAAQPAITQPPSRGFPHSSNGGRVKASPLAKKIAEQNRVDLSMLSGSGPQGRIVRKDVEAASSGSRVAEITAERAATRTISGSDLSLSSATIPHEPAASGPSQSTQAVAPGGSLETMSKMRETIARRMQESVRDIPHFYTTVSINMGEALKLREVLKEQPDYKGISVNHLVIKACGYALQRVPRVNCAYRDGRIFTPNSINIGIITSIEDGLLIPVIRDVPALALKDLVFESRAAVERARAGRPTSADLSGGTFSISNMGMFDVDNFTAIINPGQGAVLAVSAVKQEPIIANSQVVAGSIMRVTLSVDHRIIDGLMAAQFTKHLKQALEMPALLML